MIEEKFFSIRKENNEVLFYNVHNLYDNKHKLEFGDVFLKLSENNDVVSWSGYEHLDNDYIKNISNDLKSDYIYHYVDLVNKTILI